MKKFGAGCGSSRRRARRVSRVRGRLVDGFGLYRRGPGRACSTPITREAAGSVMTPPCYSHIARHAPGGGAVFSTIVIGLDGSETAQHACDDGVELAKQLGAHDPPRHRLLGRLDAPSPRSLPNGSARPRSLLDVDGAPDARPTDGGITNHAQRGSPAATILKVADEIDADLIVVGNRGMTGVRRVLGSVASAVTTQAPCTVLVVKTTRPGFVGTHPWTRQGAPPGTTRLVLLQHRHAQSSNVGVAENPP